MMQADSDLAQQIAQVAVAVEQNRTGQKPRSVAVVLCDDRLTITLRSNSSAATEIRGGNATRAAQETAVDRPLPNECVPLLRREIERIIGVRIREAAEEGGTTSGAAMRVFRPASSLERR